MTDYADIIKQLRREAARGTVDDSGFECCAAPHWTCCNPVLLTDAAAEIERLTKERDDLRESRNRLIRIEGILQRNLRQAQIALCPKFEQCGDLQGDGCTCFPDDGPFANAVPPNVAAIPADIENNTDKS